jgi:hypothetical protein
MAKPDKPKTFLPWPREECYDAPMPCPIVSCRFNTYLEVDPRNGDIRFNHWLIEAGQKVRELEPEELTVPNCALHIADRSIPLDGAELVDDILSHEWIGEKQFGVSKQRVQQVEEDGFRKIRAKILSIKNADLAEVIRSMFGKGQRHDS